MTPSKRYPRGIAYHEAGHAVVAWSLGLPVGAVGVSDEDAIGSTQIGLSDHLPLIEQIAVCSAGIAAVEIFGHPIHELAGFKDHERIMRLIEVHGISEEGQGPALRKEGYSFARARFDTAHDTENTGDLGVRCQRDRRCLPAQSGSLHTRA
jgi:hypothetical protein